MKTHSRPDVGAAARQFQRQCAPEAVADGRNPRRIDLGLRAKRRQSRLGAAAGTHRVGRQHPKSCCHLFAIAKHFTLAVKIQPQHRVAERRQTLAALLMKVIEARRLGRRQDRGPRATAGVIDGEEADHVDTVALIRNRLRVDHVLSQCFTKSW